MCRSSGTRTSLAVITVPADFSPPQTEATSAAARLAGFDVSPLLQEPIAAAIAYGFDQQGTDRSRWLVYDLGGGTFDVALIEKRDGMLRWKGHGGDKYLGGKNIDRAIVEKILIPPCWNRPSSSRRIYPDFQTNPKYRGALAKLKLEAEAAKIRLSRLNPPSFPSLSFAKTAMAAWCRSILSCGGMR